MPQNPSPRAAMEIELTKLSSPRIFLVRMLVFLVLCALVMVVLYKQIIVVFFGLLGTFWGLIETVGSVGKVIEGLKVGGDAGSLFDTLKEGLAAPLGGMGISFSSSLFGLAGSLILGFLDLQSSQAQNRFYTDLEDWLASTVREYGDGGSGLGGELQHAMERIRAVVEESGGSRSTTAAMANLAEAIQGLVAHMRTEQQMIREWADGQGEQNREIKKLLERIAKQPEKS